ITRRDFAERFVRQQAVGPPNQRCCDLQAPAFPTGNACNRSVESVIDSDLLQDALHAIPAAESPLDRLELSAEGQTPREQIPRRKIEQTPVGQLSKPRPQI